VLPLWFAKIANEYVQSKELKQKYPISVFHDMLDVVGRLLLGIYLCQCDMMGIEPSLTDVDLYLAGLDVSLKDMSLFHIVSLYLHVPLSPMELWIIDINGNEVSTIYDVYILCKQYNKQRPLHNVFLKIEPNDLHSFLIGDGRVVAITATGVLRLPERVANDKYTYTIHLTPIYKHLSPTED